MFRLGKREKNNGEADPSSIELFTQDIVRLFPDTKIDRDIFRQEIVLMVPVNSEILLAICIPYNFPVMQPTVKLIDSVQSNLQGIQAMVRCGLLDIQTSLINYNRCFAWTPSINGSLFVFLVSLIIKIAVTITQDDQDQYVTPLLPDCIEETQMAP